MTIRGHGRTQLTALEFPLITDLYDSIEILAVQNAVGPLLERNLIILVHSPLQ